MSVLGDKIVTHILGLSLPGGLPFPISELSLMAATMVHQMAQPDLVFEGTNFGCSARIFFEVDEMMGLKTRESSNRQPPVQPEAGGEARDVE